MSINPIKATEAISINYQKYLSTTFRFQDPNLQEQLLESLREEGRFVKGPVLEVTPAFKAGASIAELVKEGVLSKGFYQLQSDSLPLERKLYLHQERAVRKLATHDRNIVVSTGTGSGKTETFLIPILDHLFKEAEKGLLGPGVRALLLYPMNALANDQLKRLRLLLARYPNITFGRYTGETEKLHRNALEKHRKLFRQEPLPNELISREQMWVTPPHILLTNYAMLEYLLLRPVDTIFFDGDQAKHWRFIVIDEAHTYSGAKGIEIAMLLRRLKDRVVGSQRGTLRCIATSATLGGGQGSYPLIVQYAEQLFGENFEWVEGDESRQDVVESVRLPLVGGTKSWGRPEPWFYAELEKLVNKALPPGETLDEMRHCSLKAEIPDVVLAKAVKMGHELGWQAFLYEVLKDDQNVLKLQQVLQEKPVLLLDLPKALGLTSQYAAEAVVSLVNMANLAKTGEGSQPLLPARYHLFVRAIEGAYLSLQPEKKLFLERHEKIKKDGEEYQVFEAATCRQCGAAYLVGQRERDGSKEVLKSVAAERGRIEYFLLLEKETEAGDHNEDEAVEFPEDSVNNKYRKHLLCLRCGTIDRDNVLRFPCDCGEQSLITLLHVPSNPEGKIFLCPSCGKRSPSGVTRRFIVGTDASASVLASALYQQLIPKKETETGEKSPTEEDEDEWASHPAEAVREGREEWNEGLRKLLVFSDSRQDAAFFAPYLNRTYNQILHRSLIIRTLLENSDTAVNNSWRLQDLITPLRKVAVNSGFFKGSSPQEQINEVWKWVMQEFLAIDRMISLEGLGLLSFALVKPSNWVPPKALQQGKWNLTSVEVLSLLEVLLDSVRRKGAVVFPEQVSPKDEFFQPRNHEFFLRANEPVPRKGILSWNSVRLNGRLDYLLRLAKNMETGITEQECRSVLDNIWRKVLNPEGSQQWKPYFASQITKDEGVVYQLRHNLWELKSSLINDQVVWYICDKCKSLTLHNIRGTCPTYRCDGRLQQCDHRELFEDNHYYRLYLNILPIKMQAEEHTAQLTSEAAAEMQNKFIFEDVNILSCSTTF